MKGCDQLHLAGIQQCSGTVHPAGPSEYNLVAPGCHGMELLYDFQANVLVPFFCSFSLLASRQCPASVVNQQQRVSCCPFFVVS